MSSSFDSLAPGYRTEEMLEAWGRWSFINGKGISIFGVIMQTKMGTVLKAAIRITDDEALRVDRAMGELKMRDLLAYSILDDVYRCRQSVSALERKLGISRREIDSIIDRSIGFIDGRLFDGSGVLVA